jgi:hypothetical protein
MYAYAKVIIERPGVRALPLAALTYSGEKTYCWKYENGRAVRREIQTGVTDGQWIEVTNLQVPTTPQNADPWAAVDGSEQMILGDLATLTDGGPVEVAGATGATNVAGATKPQGTAIAGDSTSGGLTAGRVEAPSSPVRRAGNTPITQRLAGEN